MPFRLIGKPHLWVVLSLEFPPWMGSACLRSSGSTDQIRVQSHDYLHRSRSCATLIQSLYDIFVHSLMLSVHIVLGLPRPPLPFILPSISNRCTPSPLIICPKYWHLLFLIVFNSDLLVFILCNLYTKIVSCLNILNTKVHSITSSENPNISKHVSWPPSP